MSIDTIASLKSNFLLVDKKKLAADVLPVPDAEKLSVSAEDLEPILSSRSIGRSAILRGIEEYFVLMQKRNPSPNLARPSIWIAHLSTDAQTHRATNEVFTQKGYDGGDTRTSRDDMLDTFHGHWDAVKNAGFLPEVKKVSGKKNKDAGAWLLLRKPSVEQVAKQWFGYVENREMVITRATPGLDRDLIKLYSDLGQELVEELEVDGYSDMRMGLNLAVAALKRTIGDTDGFLLDVDETMDQADQDVYRRESAVLAIYNSTYTS